MLFLFQIKAVNGQSVYIGLESELDASSVPETSGNYWVQMQIIDDFIYMPTPIGLYRKSLNSLNNTEWELFAFQGFPIRDFVKDQNEILAITAHLDDGTGIADSVLLYSADNGLTFNHLDAEPFLQSGSPNTLYRIAHNPLNIEDVVVLHQHGVLRSADFGNSWTSLHQWTPTYQYRFIAFHPLNPSTIFYTGETGFYSSYVQASYNDGLNWTNTDDVPNNCTHHIAFHPTDQNKIVSGGEGRITRSNDEGNAWEPSFFIDPYLYIYKIVYDESNSNMLYASGALNGVNDSIYILKSSDGGSTWSIIHQEEMLDSGGITDFELYDEKIIFATGNKGVFFLDLDVLASLEPDQVGLSSIVFPNPARSVLNIRGKEIFSRLEIMDLTGKLIKTIQTHSRKTSLDISELSEGFYILKVFNNRETETLRFTKR